MESDGYTPIRLDMLLYQFTPTAHETLLTLRRLILDDRIARLESYRSNLDARLVEMCARGIDNIDVQQNLLQILRLAEATMRGIAHEGLN